MRHPAALALAAALAAACSSTEPDPCPGTAAATFRLKGDLRLAGDPAIEALDPVRELPDCTPDPLDPNAPNAPIEYPLRFVPFEATLSVEPEGTAAALCRPNGAVLTGVRTASGFRVEASAESAILCGSACSATLRLVVAADVVEDPGGGPAALDGVLVEVLEEGRGACDACLPAVPGTEPPERACAARYRLRGGEI